LAACSCLLASPAAAEVEQLDASAAAGPQNSLLANATSARADEAEVHRSSISAMLNLMRTFEYQYAICVAAGVLGLVSVWDGWIFSQCLFIGLAALAVGTATSWEVSAQLGDQLGEWGPCAVGFEAAAVTVAACYLGFEGFQLQVGGAFGLVVAHFAASVVKASTWNGLGFLGLYAISGLLGVLFVVVGGRKAFAVVGPAVGGLLLACLAGYIAIDLFYASRVPWIDFVEAVVVGGREPFTSLGDKGPLARYLLLGIWAAATVIGVAHWFLARSGAEGDDAGPPRAPFLQSNAEPLLPPPAARPQPQHGRGGGVPLPPPPKNSFRKSGRSAVKDPYNIYD